MSALLLPDPPLPHLLSLTVGLSVETDGSGQDHSETYPRVH
jgi:hypothetical protein